MADSAPSLPAASPPDTGVEIRALKHLDVEKMGKDPHRIARFLDELKEIAEDLARPDSGSSIDRPHYLQEPLKLENTGEKKYLVYANPNARALHGGAVDRDTHLYLADLFNLMQGIKAWMATFYAKDFLLVRQLLQDQDIQRNLVTQLSTTEKGKTIVYESVLYDYKFDFLKQVSKLQIIANWLLITESSVDPELANWLAELITELNAPNLDWEKVREVWKKERGLRQFFEQARTETDKNFISLEANLASLLTSVLRASIYREQLLNLANDDWGKLLREVVLSDFTYSEIDPNQLNSEFFVGFTAFFDRLFLTYDQWKEEFGDLLKKATQPSSQPPSATSAETVAEGGDQEAATSDLPAQPITPEEFDQTPPTSQFELSSRTLNLNIGFLQNQIATQLFVFYGIPVSGSAFQQLPPDLRYELNRAIRANLATLSPADLNNLAISRLRRGQEVFRSLIERNPVFLAKFQNHLILYLQTLPPDIRERLITQGLVPETLVAQIQRDIETFRSPSGEVANSYAKQVFGQASEFGDETLETQAFSDLSVLHQTHFYNHNLVENENLFSQTLRAFGLSPHEILDIQVKISNGIAAHEDPRLYLRLLGEMEFIKSLSPTDRIRFQLLCESYWSQQLHFLVLVTAKPSIASPISTTPSDQNSETLLELSASTIENFDTKDVAVKDLLEKMAQLPQDEGAANTTLTPLMLLLAQHFTAEELKDEAIANHLKTYVLLPLVASHPRAASVVAAQYKKLIELNQEFAKNTADTINTSLSSGQITEFSRRMGAKAPITSVTPVEPKKPSMLLAPLSYRKQMALEFLPIPPFEALDLAGNITEEETVVSPTRTLGKPTEGNTTPLETQVVPPGRTEQQRAQTPRVSTVRDIFKALRGKDKALGSLDKTGAVSKTKLLVNTLGKTKNAVDKTLQALKTLSAIRTAIASAIGLISAIGGPLLAGALALGGAALAAIGPALAAAAAIGGGILAGTKIAEGLGFGQGATAAAPGGATAVGVTTGGGAAAPASGLAKAAQAAAAQVKTSAIVGVGGTGGLVLVGAAVTMITQGAILDPIPTFDSQGDYSQYVEIVKRIDAGNALTNEQLPTTINYTITIKPKDNYRITITDVTDTMTFTFQEDSDQSHDPVVRGLDQFETIEAGTVIEPGSEIVLTYSQAIEANMNDSRVKNAFKLDFEYVDTTSSEDQGSDSATTNEFLCIGECPSLGEGCWPVSGKITQGPHGNPRLYANTHATIEAIDFNHPDNLTSAEYEDAPVYTPYAGEACSFPEGSARLWHCGATLGAGCYGNLVVVTMTDGSQLGFAHLSFIDPALPQSAGQCTTVEPGTVIGGVGNSGLPGGGIHLHYEVRGLRMADIVPEAIEIKDVVSCYDE